MAKKTEADFKEAPAAQEVQEHTQNKNVQWNDRTEEFKDLVKAFECELSKPVTESNLHSLEKMFLERGKPFDKIVVGRREIRLQKLGDTVLPLYFPIDDDIPVYGDLTKESVNKIIAKAEELSGIPAKDLTPERALLIVGGKITAADLRNPDTNIEELSRIYFSGDMWSGFTGVVQSILEMNDSNIEEKINGSFPITEEVNDFEKAIKETIEELRLSNETKYYFLKAIATSAQIAKQQETGEKLISGVGQISARLTEELDKLIKSKQQELAEQVGALIEQHRDEIVKAPETIIPLLQAITPNYHVMPNNKLMNVMQEPSFINGGAFDLVVSNASGRRKEITSYTMIEYNGDDDTNITPVNLTEYERQVSDAIVSLWEQARADNVPPIFTADMIYRAMPGGGDRATPQQRGSITKAIDHFRQLHIYVDATEELQKRGKIQPGETFVIDDYYLSATRAEYKTKNGRKKVTAYKINNEPIMLNYAKQTGQILSVPAKYIEIKDNTGVTIMMSADRQAITGYLLRQIAWIKYDRNHKRSNPRSDVISFETLFIDVGIDTTSRTITNRHRDFIFEVLDYEKTVGNISGYTKQIKGRTITGVKIIP